MLDNKLTNYLIILTIVILSFLTRFPGYDNRMLWHDELWRINLILSDDLITRFSRYPDIFTSTTAPLYIAFIKLLSFFDLSPASLRLSSFIPGVLSPALAYLIIKKASKNTYLALTCSFIFIANLNFIHYSKEMKPYAFEVFMHLLCLYAWVSLIFSKLSNSKIYLLVLSMSALVLSGANCVFIFPAICISTTYLIYLKDKKFINLILFNFLILLMLCSAMYYFNWQYGRSKSLHDFWEVGFYDNTKSAYLYFIINKLTEMWSTAFITIGSNLYISIVIFLSYIFSLLFSLKNIFNRKYLEKNSVLLLITTYLITVTLLNLLKMWPLGSLRTNLFIYGHFIILIFLVVSTVQNNIIKNIVILTIAIAETISLPKIYSFDFNAIGINGHKTDYVWDSFKSNNEAYIEIQQQCQNGMVIVIMSNSMDSAKDYLIKKDLRSGSKKSILLAECVKIIRLPTDQSGWDYTYLRKIISEANGNNKPIWFLYGGIIDENLSKISETLSKLGAIKLERKFDISGYLLVVPRNKDITK